MSDRPPDPAELDADTPQGSVFGNLPDSRPGGRSPLRDPSAKPRRSPAKTKASAKPRASAKPKVAAKPRPGARPKPAGGRKPATPPPEPAAAEPESGGGLEDVAWAGVAVAAEAATAGVRLLSKTIEALRGNSERT
jgi:hypothetical protein